MFFYFSDIINFATCIFLEILRPRLGGLGVYKKHMRRQHDCVCFLATLWSGAGLKEDFYFGYGFNPTSADGTAFNP